MMDEGASQHEQLVTVKMEGSCLLQCSSGSSSSDDAPKDLSLKTKKLKHIPPPLNLIVKHPDSVSVLKDFAAIATSPKSPLMQKNLPFRKRAYSFSGANDAAPKPVPPPTPTSSSDGGGSQEVSPHPSYLPASSHSSPGPLQTTPSPSPKILHPSEAVRHPGVLNMSLLDTSALLSPAPSSLGSSQEELCYSPNWSSRGLPYPLPIWHCFLSGTRVRVDQLGGCWQLVDDLASSPSSWSADKLLPLFLEVIQLVQGSGDVDDSSVRVSLQFSYINCLPTRVSRPWEGQVLAECELYHPFYVKDKGWCAVRPDLALQQFGFHCQNLERGDICIPTSSFAIMSPDICERFKRFSFPPEEVPPLHPPSVIRTSATANSSSMPPPTTSQFPSPEGLLSPPSSPTKKMLDAMRPKRPMNAFMLFAKKYRLELIQRYPGKDNRAISVLLGEAWRSLPSEDREVYVQDARIMAQEQKRLHPDCWKRKRSHSTS